MLTACRIVRPRHASDAFSGDGARLHGGRWNSRGHPVVYTSATVSLSTLELLVHLPRQEWIREFRIVHCWFPDAIVEEIDRSTLPSGWRAYPASPALQDIGNRWLAARTSAVLAVPSAVIESENNYLINPEHPDFRSVDIGEPHTFSLDRRLFT